MVNGRYATLVTDKRCNLAGFGRQLADGRLRVDVRPVYSSNLLLIEPFNRDMSLFSTVNENMP